MRNTALQHCSNDRQWCDELAKIATHFVRTVSTPYTVKSVTSDDARFSRVCFRRISARNANRRAKVP